MTHLNVTHRVGLFVVAVGTGIAFILDATVKQTIGLALLGLTTTWFIGGLSASVRLAISYAALAGGLLITAWSVVPHWRQYRASARSYDAAIDDLRQVLSEADAVNTPIGPMRFSRDLQAGERQKTIKTETENKRSNPAYEVSGTIVLPESIRRWQTPSYAPATLPFDQAKTADEELRWIESTFLVPKPLLAYSPLYVTAGLGIFAVGLVGCVRLHRSQSA